MKRTTWLVLLLAATGGCEGNRAVRLSGGGATFIDPIMQKWSYEYHALIGTEVDYSKSGSSDGIRKMTERELEFGCSDAPMKKEQTETARKKGGEVIHVPMVLGGVAIVYNLPGISDLRLSGPVIADIYRGAITHWDDPEIAALNPGVEFPSTRIVQVYRSEGSGTTSIFTEFLSKVSPEFKKSIGVSTAPKWPEIGTGQKGSDGVSSHVQNNPGSIGYVEVSYASSNAISVARVRNASGNFVLPSTEAVTAAGDWAVVQPQKNEPYSLHDLTYSLTNAAGSQAYPICGISYAVFYKRMPSRKGKALVDFLTWAVTDGQKYAVDLYYAPLPAALSTRVVEKLKTLELTD